MKRQVLSIITEVALIIVGVIILYQAQVNLSTGAQFYKSAGFYPSILCCLLIACSVVGIIKDAVSLKHTPEDIVVFGNLKNGLLICVLIAATIVLWETTRMFYLAVFLLIFLSLYFFHEPERGKTDRIKTAAKFSIIFMVAAYLIFHYALKIKF